VKYTITAALIAMHLLSACSQIRPGDLNAPTPLPVGRCLTSRDCPAREYCEHPDRYFPCGTCLNDPSLNECDGERACPTGQICVSVAPPCYCGYNICIEPCTTAGCPPGQRCRNDRTCEPLACNADAECEGAYCINGMCSQALGYCDSLEPRP
jgi:hypothetical protein